MLQPAQRACTAAASAMLILDRGGQLNTQDLLYRNLGDTQAMICNIEQAGLTPLAHVIIVDAIDNDGVDIRDSFHGRSIKITKEAFLSRYSKSPLIQIR
tara:strand:+ start:4277 stop:4573 length:297 start_codon:yes stop_codon:yes gene_type:complete